MQGRESRESERGVNLGEEWFCLDHHTDAITNYLLISKGLGSREDVATYIPHSSNDLGTFMARWLKNDGFSRVN
jgi:hypothetical protein